MNRVSGGCGWLTSEEVIEVMEIALLDYDTVEVEDATDMEQYGEPWYGIRLCITIEEAPEEEIIWKGKARTVARRDFLQEDHNYYFNHKKTRDVVQAYLTA
jgi:hypothetical protein